MGLELKIDNGKGLFLDHFKEWVCKTPSAVAASDGPNHLTYSQLDIISDNISEMLVSEGVKSGDIVGISLDRGLAFLASMIGIFKSRAAYMPLAENIPFDRRAFMVTQCACKVVLVDPVDGPSFEGAKSVAISRSLDQFRALRQMNGPVVEGPSEFSLAYVIFTSGSTGQPKGAMVHHAGMQNHLRAKIEDLDMHVGPNVAQTATQSFDISVWQFLAPLLCGGRTTILTKTEFLNFDSLTNRITDERVDILQVVPSHLLAILDFVEASDAASKLDQLKYIVATGEVLPIELARRWLRAKPSIPLVNAYGPTECSDDVTHEILTEEPSFDLPIPIGKPVRNVTLSIRDASGLELPSDSVGELYVQGIAVGLGYIGRPDLTDKAFVKIDGATAYRSGDLARCDSEGVYHFHGRVDDQVKIKGYRIELSEIEFSILRLDNIIQAAVVVNGTGPRASLTAFVVHATHATVKSGPEDIAAQLHSILPEHMVPTDIRTLDTLPKTPNGKIDKKKLTDFAGTAAKPAVEVAALDEAESDLLSAWRELLNYPRLSASENLFRAGADSIVALQFLVRARKLGYNLKLTDVFKTPTVAGLMKHNRSAPVSSQAPAVMSEEASSVQHGIFIQSSRTKYRNAYVLQFSFEMSLDDGGLALRRGWGDALARHDVLRSGFVQDSSGILRRFVLPKEQAHIDWTTSDFSHLTSDTLETAVTEACELDKQRNFEAGQPPLLRAHLIQLTDRVYEFVLTIHHLIIDGVSLFPLLREVLHGADQSATPRWNTTPDTAFSADQKLFWRELLAPHSTPCLIADMVEEKPESEVEYGKDLRKLSENSRRSLDAVCRTNGVTFTAVAATAWAMALQTRNGAAHQLFGLVVSGRSSGDIGLEDIGAFVNLLPVPLVLSGAESSGTNLMAAGARVGDLLNFESAPLNQTLSSLRNHFATPAFDSILNVEVIPDWNTLDSAETKIRLKRINDTTEFPLAVEIRIWDGDVFVEFVRDTKLVSEHIATELSESFFSALDFLAMEAGNLSDWSRWTATVSKPTTVDVAAISPIHDAGAGEFDGLVLDTIRAIVGQSNIDRRDNFFFVGGDSISALQLIARLKKSNLALSLDQVFSSRSIAQIAAAVQHEPTDAQDPQVSADGEASLSPIQQWFFEQEWVNHNHWTLGTAVELRQPISDSAFHTTIQKILKKYPILNARFEQSKGTYRQIIPREPVKSDETARIAAFDSDYTETLDGIRSVLLAAQSTLDLETGDMWRAILVRTDQPDVNLLIVLAHHLVIDAVSLRTLIEDFIQNSFGGDEIEEPSSFRNWLHQLDTRSHELETALSSEKQFWLDTAKDCSDASPFEPGTSQSNGTETCSRRLSADATKLLIRDVPTAYNTQVNDILIAALARAVTEWNGTNRLVINLEGHGRENLLDGVDVSGTVGWFTSLFPVRLIDRDLGTRELILDTKAALTAVPNRGIGYGKLRYLLGNDDMIPRTEPQIQFNYLGQWDLFSSGNPLFPVADVQLLHLMDEVSSDSRNGRQHALEIEIRIVHGRLEIDFHYDRSVLNDQHAEELITHYSKALETIIVHCTSGVLVREASDYPDVSITEDELNTLIKTCGHVPEDIYSLAPTQQGILFHHMMNGGEHFTLQYVLEVVGTLDGGLLDRAWRVIADRHPILRTGLLPDCIGGPVQYVLDQPNVEWTYLDHRGEPGKTEALLVQDREMAFDLNSTALTRFHMLRTGEESYKIIWTFHPILMDGWCIAPIIHQLFEVYDSLQANVSPRPYAGPVYKDYIDWLAREDTAPKDVFWSTYLEAAKSLQFEMSGIPSHPDRHVVPTLAFNLGEALSQDLTQFCAQNHVTLATIFQAVWGEILSSSTGNDTPVFGWVISGRNSDLDGAGEVMGVMSSVVPCVVSRSTQWTPERLWELQKQNSVLQGKGHTTLRDISLAAGLDFSAPLFNTALAIENFEFIENLPKTNQYSITKLEWVEKSEFDLVVGVVPGTDHLIELNYNPEIFCRSQMSELQHKIITAISDLLST